MTDSDRLTRISASKRGAARAETAGRAPHDRPTVPSGPEPALAGDRVRHRAPVTPTGSLARRPITKKIVPHPPGARRWTDRFGDALVCVRCRTEASSGRRVVTVERQVDDAPLKLRQADKTVWVRIERHGAEARALAWQFGAQWDWGAKALASTFSVVKESRRMASIVEPPNERRSTSAKEHRST